MPLRNIVALLAWSASHCSLFLHLTAAPSSAAGGGATVRPARSARLGFIQFNPNKIKKTPEGVFLLWQGQKDLKLPLRNIVALLAWSASHCSLFLHLTAAPFSAAGGGATVAPARSARLGFIQFNPNKTKKTPEGVFLLWQGQKDLNPRHAVLETAFLPLFINIFSSFGGISGAHTA